MKCLLIFLLLTSPLLSAEGRVIVLSPNGQPIYYSDLSIYLFKSSDFSSFTQTNSNRYYPEYRLARDVYESIARRHSRRRDLEFDHFGFRVSSGQQIIGELSAEINAAQKVLEIERKFWHGVEQIKPIVLIHSRAGHFTFPVIPNTIMFARTNVPLRIWVVSNPKDGILLSEKNRSGSILSARYKSERKK